MCSQPLFLSSSMVLQKAMSSLKEAYGKVILCLLCFFVIVAEGLGGMLKKAITWASFNGSLLKFRKWK